MNIMNYLLGLCICTLIGLGIAYNILNVQYTNLQNEYIIIEAQLKQEKINNVNLIAAIDEQNTKIEEAKKKSNDIQTGFDNISSELDNLQYSPFKSIQNSSSNEDIFKWLLKNSSQF